MNNLILIAGLAMVAALAVAAVRPAWRLPVLAFGLLAIPGNVDDLLPSMTMDLHDLVGSTAPAITVNDLLLGWALALTLYERRAMGRAIGNVVILGLVVAAVATISAGIAAAGGVEPTAALRGALVFVRIPVYLYVAGALRAEIGDGRLLGLAIVAGGVLLLGNGVFTTIVDDPERFTARTFGRNGLAVALTIVAVVATGVAAHLVDRFGLRRWQSWVAIGCSMVAIASVFAMTQTGTRMALLLLLGSSLLALLAFPKAGLRARVRPVLVVGGILVLTLAASNLTVAGSRSISIVDPGATIDAVGDLEGSQATSELRSRGMFWQSAIAMARANPVFGVGPFQWNIQRYELDPTEPVLVVDPHLSYLQVAAEFGLPTLIGYLALLAAALVTVVANLRTRAARASLGWSGLGIVIAAVILPLGSATNSHLFNPRNGPMEWLLIGASVAMAVAVGERLRATTPEPATMVEPRPTTSATPEPAGQSEPT